MTADMSAPSALIELVEEDAARARLAGMPRGELEALALRATIDAVTFCAAASEMELAIVEAHEFLKKGQVDLARRRLAEILETLGKLESAPPACPDGRPAA